MTQTELYEELVKAEKEYREARYFAKCSKNRKDRDYYDQEADMVEVLVRNLFNSCPDAGDLSNEANFLSPHYFESDLERQIVGLKNRLFVK